MSARVRRPGVELHDLDLEAMLARRQAMAGHVEGHHLPSPERDRRLPRDVRGPVDGVVTGTRGADGRWVHQLPVHADAADAHERAIGEAVASLEAEAVALVLETAADVELADHEVGHAHPGSLAGRPHACDAVRPATGPGPARLPGPGRRALPADDPDRDSAA